MQACFIQIIRLWVWYVEQGRQLKKLNRQQQGWGNFLIAQWCTGVEIINRVFLGTTQQYANQAFKAQYATQSGPMLVINRQLNSRFLGRQYFL